MKRLTRQLKRPQALAFTLFIAITIVCIAQISWWVYFQILIADEQINLAHSLSATPATQEVIAEIEDRAFHRRRMFIAEGSFFALLTLVGAYMIYRTLHQSVRLKQEQENFIHAITHELKIPLASIKLYLETLSSDKIDKEKTTAIIPKMLDDCARLEGLIDNVLEAGRLTRDGRQIKLAPNNLSADLEEYLAGLKPMIERNRLKLTTEIEPDLQINSDYQALRRVVTALVDNAIKYSPDNRRELAVTAKRASGNCVISFRDSGIGIEAQEREKIFERFYRAGLANTRSVKGTGLGLFLVKQIVIEHKGKVELYSDGIDKGSTFTITLPLTEKA